MFELLSLIAIVLSIVGLSTARGIRNRLENEIAALKLELKRIEELRPAGAPAAEAEVGLAELEDASAAAPITAAMPAGEADAAAAEPLADAAAIPDSAAVASGAQPDPAVAAETAAPRQSLESMIAAKWTVWVGGLALALAGIFAVKYSIEQALFSPAVRLSAATLFGIVLIGAGELLRRRALPVGGAALQHAMIPGVLTAAGTITLFGAIYVAHGFYGYFGPTAAFILLAIVSFLTLGLSMLHGQALAGLGLLGSLATPALVASSNSSPWPLFGFVALVWLATTVASRIQRWNVVQALANAGLSLWVLAYLSLTSGPEALPPLLAMLVLIAGLAFLWPGAFEPPAQPTLPEEETRLDAAGRVVASRRRTTWDDVLFPRHAITTLTAALFSMLVAVAFVIPDLGSEAISAGSFAAIVVALAFFGALRSYAIYAAVFAALAAFGGVRLLGFGAASSAGLVDSGQIYIDPALVTWLALGLGLFFAVLALATVRIWRDSHPEFVRVWVVIGALTPLALSGFSFLLFGDYRFDLTHGLHAVLLALLFLGSALYVDGDRGSEGRFVLDRDLMVAASWAFLILALLVMTNGIATTIGATLLGFAYLNGRRARDWPVLPWAMVASAVFVAGRIAWEPTIVGAEALSTTPVFNQLLAGYGIPALLLALSAWIVRGGRDGRLRNVMEALACLFALLTIAILVRHAMNGGVLDSSAPSLAEQAIYTLLAIGASVTLMALDLRRPSIIFRTGSTAIGYISMVSIILAHFIGLNPYFTGESTGGIPFFNLLFLAYLLPGIAYAGAAHVARGRRPRHYVIALALCGAALLFAYVTLSIRRFYHGAGISDWKGFLQAELYTYSVVWLLLGILLLVAGYRFRSAALRIASGVLVLIAVLKVFLVDMANLEGLYRALSFAGLGVALIGIGWFYQRALLGLATQEKPGEAAVPET